MRSRVPSISQVTSEGRGVAAMVAIWERTSVALRRRREVIKGRGELIVAEGANASNSSQRLSCTKRFC